MMSRSPAGLSMALMRNFKARMTGTGLHAARLHGHASLIATTVRSSRTAAKATQFFSCRPAQLPIISSNKHHRYIGTESEA